MRSGALMVAFFISFAASAFQPRIGIWANADEPGTGYAIDVQNGILVLVVFSYQATGPAQWYLASGPLSDTGRLFVATLDKYEGGQCVSCTYRPGVLQGNDGSIAISFPLETLATLVLPGGRTTFIQPFDFGYGPLPGGLLGEWIFIHDVGGITFAERFDFTQTSAPDSSGTGFALDNPRRAGCELQTGGVLAGQVLCLDMDAQDTIQNQYVFVYGLDETFRGVWISPTTQNQYAMKGFRVASKSGFTRSDATSPDRLAHALKADAALADGATAAQEAGLFEGAANRLRRALATP